MAAEFKKSYTTPFGTLGFSALHKPFDGDYSATMRFDGEARDEMMDLLEEILEADDRRKRPKQPWVDEKDDDGNPTGAIIVRFRKSAGGVTKDTGEPWEAKPVDVFDSKGKPTGAIPGEGSIVRVRFGVRQTRFDKEKTNHLKFQPYAVQIKSLVPYVPGGFGEVEDGWEADDDYTPPPRQKSEQPAKARAAQAPPPDDGDDEDDEGWE